MNLLLQSEKTLHCLEANEENEYLSKIHLLGEIMCPLVGRGVGCTPAQWHHSNEATTNVANHTIAKDLENTHLNPIS